MTTLRPELLDELLADYETPEDLLGDEGLFKQLKKALLERALGAELTDHLGYEKGDPAGRGTGNSRNGHSGKTVLTEDGEVDLEVPRDRNGTFEPAIVPKGERRLDGFDDRILSLYARGMTVREIQGHLHELYRIEVSPDLISRVTDAVLEEVREWQNRPLDAVYPVVFFDALRVKIRDEGLVRNKAVYLALGITCQGEKEVLGLWIEQTGGGQVLAQGDERAADPRRRRRPDRGGRRSDGLPRRDRHGVPADRGSDLHRAFDPQLADLRLLEGPQEGHARSEGGLPGRDGRGGGGQARRVRSGLGIELPGGRAGLAARLGTCGADVRFPAGDPEADLHHECP